MVSFRIPPLPPTLRRTAPTPTPRQTVSTHHNMTHPLVVNGKRKGEDKEGVASGFLPWRTLLALVPCSRRTRSVQREGLSLQHRLGSMWTSSARVSLIRRRTRSRLLNPQSNSGTSTPALGPSPSTLVSNKQPIPPPHSKGRGGRCRERVILRFVGSIEVFML